MWLRSFLPRRGGTPGFFPFWPADGASAVAAAGAPAAAGAVPGAGAAAGGPPAAGAGAAPAAGAPGAFSFAFAGLSPFSPPARAGLAAGALSPALSGSA